LICSFTFGTVSIRRELVHALRVVRDRTVRVDRDGDRTHAEEAEGDEAEREDRRHVVEVERHDGAQRVLRQREDLRPRRVQRDAQLRDVIAAPISTTSTTPIQYALKLPAVRPASTLSDAPPSLEEVTTSRTCPSSSR
jgi:hypothetical protein